VARSKQMLGTRESLVEFGTSLASSSVVLTIEDALGMCPVQTPDERWAAFRAAEGSRVVPGRPPHWWWRKEVRRTLSCTYELSKTAAARPQLRSIARGPRA
jgi:hypothetical protein